MELICNLNDKIVLGQDGLSDQEPRLAARTIGYSHHTQTLNQTLASCLMKNIIDSTDYFQNSRFEQLQFFRNVFLRYF